MYQNIKTKVLTGEVRLSYCNLITARAAKQGGDPKYSVTLLIPKTDTATIADIQASMQAAYDDGVSSKWGGAHPAPKTLLHDGDGLRESGLPYGDECKGHFVITASTKNPPQVVGIDNINCELAPSDIYSGMYARVTARVARASDAVSAMCSRLVTESPSGAVPPLPQTLRVLVKASRQHSPGQMHLLLK